MDSRRSYLDTLNEGRQRKSATSIEHLSRSLEQLEQQLSLRERASEELHAAMSDSTRKRNEMPYSSPLRDVPEQQRPREERSPAWGRSDPYADSTGLSLELRALRDEMRQQRSREALRESELRDEMNVSLHREFETLRRELEQTYAAATARNNAQLDTEIERLLSSVHVPQERNDEKSLNLLRLELEQVKSVIGALAREETVRSVGQRWDDIETRLAGLQTPFGADPKSEAALDGLRERLEQIGRSINQLPEQLSISRLEEKIRNLAAAIDQFSRMDDRGDSFATIERRLEEISRAIVATSMSAQKADIDPKQFERIEARINLLARKLEDANHGKPGLEVLDRLDRLAQQVEDLARAGSSNGAAADLSREIGALNDRLAAGVPTQTDKAFEQIERRLAEVSKRLEKSSAPSASEEAILGLQDRLDRLASKMETTSSEPSVDPSLIRALETQLNALSGFFAQTDGITSELVSIAPRLDRLEATISESRDDVVEAAREAAEKAVKNFVGSRGDAEAWAGLTEDLKTLEKLTRQTDDRNTRTFEAIHETLIKVVDRLGQLDQPTHADQFIHFDRLGQPMQRPQPAPPRPVVQASYVEQLSEADQFTDFEQFGKSVAKSEETPKLDVGEAPSLDIDEVSSLDDTSDDAVPLVEETPTPAQAAAAAAAAALADADGADAAEGKPRRGFGGLARVFRRKETVLAAPQEPTMQEVEPMVEDATIDPEAANRPLEPGSGAPDLSAIMRRVREDRDLPGSQTESEAARSDFIAAARRAAQAAAAEAEVLKRSADEGKPSRRSKLADLLKGRKKPILLATAAIIVALAGLQLGSSFVKDPAEIAGAGKAVPATADATAETAAATAETPAPVQIVGKQIQSGDGAAGAAATAAETPAVKDLDTAAPLPETEPAAPAQSADQEEPQMAAVPAAAVAKPQVAAVQKHVIPADAGPVVLREAAENGDAKALFEIGSRYADGRGVKSDMSQAAKWYEESAELGFAPSQYRIGNLYEKGLGVTRDAKKAKTWYQLAANQGNASAMHNLAVLFATGAEGAPDNESAARWFTKAAALGVKDSQFNLGILSAKGVGMQQDLEAAYKWFALVANTGDRDAAQKRDEIANALRPEQLAKARGEVSLWKAEVLDPEANSVEIPESWQEGNDRTAGIDMEKAVRNVQALLNKAGYDAGAADGVMGEKTRQAIAAFQKANGMEPTGNLDEKMVRELLAKK